MNRAQQTEQLKVADAIRTLAVALGVSEDETRQRLAEYIANTERDERRQLQRLVDFDDLTQVANVRALRKALPTAEADSNTVIIMFDANNFGLINKKYGHGEGDRSLITITQGLSAAAKKFGLEHRVFRVGGDEFVILSPVGVAEKLRDAAETSVDKALAKQKKKYSFEVSVSGTIGQTHKEADALLQAAKALRKGLTQTQS
jgi:diguanylate cyclase (GGDEF)-like protein